VSSPAEIATEAVDACFAAFGVAATYTPPGGGSPIPCTVIRDGRDRQPTGTFGRPVIKGTIVEVRASEIAALAKDGTFVFLDTSEVVAILSDPESTDAERLVWDCTVK